MPRETPTGTPDGILTTFTLSAAPASGTEIVIVDRALQKPGTDYTLVGTSIIFQPGSIPQTNAILDCLYGASVGPIGVSATPPWDTVATIISDAALELGLVSAPITDPFASTDQNIAQMRALLKSGCRELGRQRQWTHLLKQYAFTTVQGQAAYSLPSDFRNMLDQSGWNRTNRLPIGTASPQEWEYLKARLVGLTLNVLMRPWLGQLFLYPDVNTPGGYAIAFEYLSRFFVQPAGQGSPTSETPANASDLICFESYLVTKKLKLDFLKAKGFDTTSAQNDYDEALQQVAGDDTFAPVLSLNGGGGAFREPLLGAANVPLVGFGN